MTNTAAQLGMMLLGAWVVVGGVGIAACGLIIFIESLKGIWK